MQYYWLSLKAQFSNPLVSFVKMLVMMIGEFDYGDIFYAEEEDTVYFVEITYILFIMFVCMVTIVIMNLLVRTLSISTINFYWFAEFISDLYILATF